MTSLHSICALVTDMVAQTSSNSESRAALPQGLPYGAYSKIARRLRPKVTPQHVWEVAQGKRTSKRVSRAIASYVARLNRERAA